MPINSKPRILPICLYKGKCYWRSLRTLRKHTYPICRMAIKFPNETCNQLQHMAPQKYLQTLKTKVKT